MDKSEKTFESSTSMFNADGSKKEVEVDQAYLDFMSQKNFAKKSRSYAQ